MKNCDVCIIGAGPVGLFAAFQAGMLGMKACIVDSLSFIGGQCSALYPEKPIYDIPAHPSITAKDLIENLSNQLGKFDAEILLNTKAKKYSGDSKSGFILECLQNEKIVQIKTNALVVAIGSGSFGPNRPPLDGIEEFEKSGQILYYVDKMSIFEGRNITIAGGGDSAVDWAINLSRIAKSVSIIHRRSDFRCLPSSKLELDKLSKNGLIQILTPFQLKSIISENGIMKKIAIENIETAEERNIEVDYLLPMFGLKTDISEIESWGLEMNKKRISVDKSTMQTNVEGIYSVGDICYYEGKLKLILSGFSEAATAIHSMYEIVFPDKKLHFEHSTSKF